MTQATFLCGDCGDKNQINSPHSGKIISCSTCGNKKIIESTGSFHSFASLKNDDLGNYFLVSAMTSEEMATCDKCGDLIDNEETLYANKDDSGWRTRDRADEVICEPCQKKKKLVDGVDSEEESESAFV